MQSILRWAIENSAAPDAAANQDPSSANAPRTLSNLDPGIIDHILGKPDAELMKEALAKAMNSENEEDERLQALDDFEMLVEQIDNANNIAAMKMWKPLHDLLSSPSSSDEIKTSTLWIIGTAVQNNPAAQKACLALDPTPLPTILTLLASVSTSPAMRSKAVYTLSGLLKHNADAVRSLEQHSGWQVVKSSLQDPDITVRRKVVFLLNTLLYPEMPLTSAASSQPNAGPNLHGVGSDVDGDRPAPITHPNSHASMTASSVATSPIAIDAIARNGVLDALLEALINPLPYGKDGESEGDVDFTEKLVRLFYTYAVDCRASLDARQKSELLQWLRKHDQKGEYWDLQPEEFQSLISAVSSS